MHKYQYHRQSASIIIFEARKTAKENKIYEGTREINPTFTAVSRVISFPILSTRMGRQKGNSR